MPRSKPLTGDALKIRQKRKAQELRAFSVPEEEALHILEALDIGKHHLKPFMKTLFDARFTFLSLHDKRISQQPIIGLIQPSPAEMVATLTPLLKSIENVQKDYATCPDGAFSKIDIELEGKRISVKAALQVIDAFQEALKKAIGAQKSARGSLSKNKNARVDAALKLIDFLRFLPARKKPLQEQQMFEYLDWCFALIGIEHSADWSFLVSHPWYPGEKVTAQKILREFFLKKP